MSGFARVHPVEHEQAVVSAVLDRGMSIAQARRAAAAGELPDVPAFEVGKSTSEKWVRRARARRAKPSGPLADKPWDDVSKILRDRLTAVAERMLDSLERKAKAGKATAEDLRQMSRAMREVDTFARGAEQPSKSGSDYQAERKAANAGPSNETSSEWLKRAAQGMRARARGEGADPSRTDPTPPSSVVDDGTEPTPTDERAQQEEDTPTNSLVEREIRERLDAAAGQAA